MAPGGPNYPKTSDVLTRRVRATRSVNGRQRTNINLARVGFMMMVVVVILGGMSLSVVEGTFERGPTRRGAFFELARFDNCGIGRPPIAEGMESTRMACGMRCLENEECVSYEYNTVNETCNLHNVSALMNLETKYGFTYADGVNPNVGEQHPCAVNPCNEGNLCVEECVPNGFTCECPEGMMGTYCDALAPVDGGFTSWGDWGECTDSCRRTAYRNCTNPRVVAGGKDCVGENTRVDVCGEPCTIYPRFNVISCCLPESCFNNK